MYICIYIYKYHMYVYTYVYIYIYIYTIFSMGLKGQPRISYGRFAVYCLMRLSRFFIAVGLLYAGVQWLAGTISITEP